MKIKEVIERDCCNPSLDLKWYLGHELPNFSQDRAKHVKLKFCQHCGQLWQWIRRPGEMDAGWEEVTEEDYK